MKERPILFSAPMVRAILAGQKTQTRREFRAKNGGVHPRKNDIPGMTQILRNCPYGKPGDRLWVRETWCETDREDGTPVIAYRAGGCIAIGRDDSRGPDKLIRSFAWDDIPHSDKWRPSIFMPRWASRILLEIASIRLEPLHSISEADAIAEGVREIGYTGDNAGPNRYCVQMDGYSNDAPTAIEAYRMLWADINGADSLDANPWVWVVEFKPSTLGDKA